MTDFITLSGGEGTFRAAMLWKKLHPDNERRFVFTDTLYEDADAYRFLLEGAAHLTGRSTDWIPRADQFPDYRVSADVPIAEYAGNPEWRAFLQALRDRAAVEIPELSWLCEGRDPWEIYRDRGMVGNSQRDPCSDIAKRRELRRFLRANGRPADDLFGSADRVVFGIGFHEAHRFDDGAGGGIRPRWAQSGWETHAPLIAAENDGGHWAIVAGNLETFFGIASPRLYGLGYIHNNCGGMCCKGGHAHWQKRHEVQPERYAYDAMMERKVRVHLNTESGTFLTDRRGGDGKKPLSLDEFAARMASGTEQKHENEPGESGCGCMVDGLDIRDAA